MQLSSLFKSGIANKKKEQANTTNTMQKIIDHDTVAELTNWKIIEPCHIPQTEDDNCTICMGPLAEEVVVGICAGSKHLFHRDCLAHCYTGHYLKCPNCCNVYGVFIGNQPTNGSMTITVQQDSHCEGFENAGTIHIYYDFPSGTQGAEHPHPGKPYEGTSRDAYLPDTDEGREVLRLLKLAWERRVIFTVGRSITTGKENCVIWNGIHHKTSTSGGFSQFGFPDETYFARVTAEMNEKGVK